jgi:hypothetical protein
MGEIHAALALVQRDLRTQPHTRTVSVGKYSYTYTELSALSDYLLPLLAAAGISTTYTSEPHGEAALRITCRLTHGDGSSVESSTVIVPESGSAQDVGKVLTYGRRYCLQMATGIATESDDDAAPSGATVGPSRAKPPAPAQTKVASSPQPPEKNNDSGGADAPITEAQRRKIFVRVREILTADGRPAPTDDEVRGHCTTAAQGMYNSTVGGLTKRQASGMIEWLETATAAMLTDDLPF